MIIRAIIAQGDFTQDEFNRVVALVREFDAPGRHFSVVAVSPDGSQEEGRQIVEEALAGVRRRRYAH